MSDRHYEEKKGSVSSRFIRLLQRFRLVFIVVAAGAVLFPIVYYIVDSINQKTIAEGAKMMYELDQKNGAYRAAEDKDKKAAAEKELLDLVDKTASQFSGRYAGTYALLMGANLDYQKLTAADTADKKTPALDMLRYLSRAVDSAGDGILAPVALNQLGTIVENLAALAPAASGGGSAVSLEELQKIVPSKTIGTDKPAKPEDVAFDVYKYLVDQYPKSLYSAEALVNMGFLLEARGDAKGAYDLYSRLESGYPSTMWTKMAINRKIALEANGLVTN
jgi:hypothetical protein